MRWDAALNFPWEMSHILANFANIARASNCWAAENQRAFLEDARSSAHPDNFDMAVDKGSTEKDLGTKIYDNHEGLFASIVINLNVNFDDS